MHDPGGFVPFSLTELATVIVAVLPMQHQRDVLLAQPQCLGWGVQWPVLSWGRRDPGRGKKGVSACLTHHSPVQCSGLCQCCFSRCS